MFNQFSSIKNESFAIDLLFASNTDIAGVDILTYKEYTTEQLIDKRLLLTYKEDNNEVIFYGQFNENAHWDGNCIINIYNNDKLIAVTDGLYNDGELLKYKQAFIDTDLSGEEKWFVSSRIHTEEYNTGSTLQYAYIEYRKEFEFSNVTFKDVLNVDSFNSKITSELEAFYYGNTSNGQFNDNTNFAYYVSYDYVLNDLNKKIKYVKTLYVGNFKDGNFYDTTGKAWYITKDINTDYMYYIGNFKDGHPTEIKENTPAFLKRFSLS